MGAAQAYEFGVYRVELPLRRLLRAGEPISLTPKAFDVLVALIERRDRVVDKQELMKAVWPDSFPASMSSQSGADMLRVRVAVAAGPSRRTHRPSAIST